MRERKERALICLDPSRHWFFNGQSLPYFGGRSSLPHASEFLCGSFRGQTADPTVWGMVFHPEEQRGGQQSTDVLGLFDYGMVAKEGRPAYPEHKANLSQGPKQSGPLLSQLGVETAGRSKQQRGSGGGWHLGRCKAWVSVTDLLPCFTRSVSSLCI